MKGKKKAPAKTNSRARRRSAPGVVAAGHVLVLRCCKADGTSYSGFRWPKSGPVRADDWLPKPVPGGGLHGWLWGAGDVTAAGDVHLLPEALWLVLSVPAESIVDLGGKVKFPRADVIFAGPRADAVSLVASHAPAGTVGICGTATAGDSGTATAGYRGTATAGDYGTATAGEGGCIAIRWWDGDSSRYRIRSGDVGAKETLKPGVKYRLNAAHEFEAAE